MAAFVPHVEQFELSYDRDADVSKGHPPKADSVKSLLSSYNLDGHTPARLGGRWRRLHRNNTCHSAQGSSVARLHTYNYGCIRISSSVLLSYVVYFLL